jgi:hypothetical protein
MAYLLATVAASALFLTAARRRVRKPALTSSYFDPPAGRPTPGTVAAATHIALTRLTPILISQHIRTDVAVQPGLRVGMGDGELADLLEEWLAAAAHSAPASHMLLTAAAQGDRVAISITDDVPNADAALRQSLVRGLMQRVALRGNVLDVDVRPTEGTTMTLRLPAAAPTPKAAVQTRALAPLNQEVVQLR